MTHTSHGVSIDEVTDEVRTLVDRYRSSCLWFMRDDYYPVSRAGILRVLGYLERHGDREAFRAAALVRQWLSPTSSATSAGS